MIETDVSLAFVPIYLPSLISVCAFIIRYLFAVILYARLLLAPRFCKSIEVSFVVQATSSFPRRGVILVMCPKNRAVQVLIHLKLSYRLLYSLEIVVDSHVQVSSEPQNSFIIWLY